MRFKIQFRRKEYEVEIKEEENGVKIKIGDKEFLFEREKISDKSFYFEKRDFSKKEILAPISGTISEIFVKEGEIVEKGQRIFTLSAMKMENEILSDFKGKVKKIFVKKGENVKKDQILLIGE